MKQVHKKYLQKVDVSLAKPIIREEVTKWIKLKPGGKNSLLVVKRQKLTKNSKKNKSGTLVNSVNAELSSGVVFDHLLLYCPRSNNYEKFKKKKLTINKIAFNSGINISKIFIN